MMQPRLSAIGIAATALELRPRVVVARSTYSGPSPRSTTPYVNQVTVPRAAGVVEDPCAASMKLSRDFNLYLVRPVGLGEPEGLSKQRQKHMTVGSVGNNANVSTQNYNGVSPKPEQGSEFKAALNNATTSTGASPSSKGTEQSQDTSKSLPIILANRPPIN